MAGPYDIYPSVDANYEFPPEIRAKAAASAELKLLFDAKAPLASPILTGTPQTADVADLTDSSQKIANTKFVQTKLADYDTRAVVAARGRIKKYVDFASVTADYSNINDGDIVTVGRFQYSNGILHRASTWQKSSGYLTLVGTVIWVEASDRNGTYQSALSIVNQITASTAGFALFTETRFRNVVTTHEYVWDGTRLVPPRGILAKKAWAQWNYGPAPRGDWWAPPFDTWRDPYGICSFGNGIATPAQGWYRCSGNFGYQQTVSNERLIFSVRPNNSASDVWAGPGLYSWGDTGLDFSITFYSEYNVGWQFYAYHSGGGDLYAISGNNNNENGPNSKMYWEFLGPYV